MRQQQEVKVKLTLSEGYQERFTRACIKVAQRRLEGGGRGQRTDHKKGRLIGEGGRCATGSCTHNLCK